MKLIIQLWAFSSTKINKLLALILAQFTQQLGVMAVLRNIFRL